MAESQSRFSIIDELVEKKKTAQDSINIKLNEIKIAELDLKKWEKNVELSREDKQQNLDLLKEKNQREIATFKDMLTQYDMAIESIKVISSQEKT